jgi:DNA (cytosine-5)-methyltransferase 1
MSYVRLLDAIDYVRGRAGERPAVAVWENVPGVLSSKDNAFGCFLGALAGEDVELQPPGKKWANAGCVFGPSRTVAWRVLDAQYFGVAQRRRRVFVVASARKDFNPVDVLFEFDGVRRDSAPSREAGEETAGTLASRTGAGGFPGTDEACSGYLQAFGGGNTRGSIDVGTCLTTKSQRLDFDTETFAVQAVADTLTSNWHKSGGATAGNNPGIINPVFHGPAVRRLMPVECERLQGFPDGWTDVPYRGKRAADGPRYKSLGNSMAVPVMRWIGERIQRAGIGRFLDQTLQPRSEAIERPRAQAIGVTQRAPLEIETHVG